MRMTRDEKKSLREKIVTRILRVDHSWHFSCALASSTATRRTSHE
jgi:hypothetical protein